MRNLGCFKDGVEITVTVWNGGYKVNANFELDYQNEEHSMHFAAIDGFKEFFILPCTFFAGYLEEGSAVIEGCHYPNITTTSSGRPGLET